MASSPDEIEALVRLSEHELALDHQLDLARKEAQELLARVRQDVDRLRAEAKVKLREELDRLRRERARELEAAIGATQREIQSTIGALSGVARANRERALAFLVARVTGADAT